MHCSHICVTRYRRWTDHGARYAFLYECYGAIELPQCFRHRKSGILRICYNSWIKLKLDRQLNNRCRLQKCLLAQFYDRLHFYDCHDTPFSSLLTKTHQLFKKRKRCYFRSHIAWRIDKLHKSQRGRLWRWRRSYFRQFVEQQSFIR